MPLDSEGKVHFTTTLFALIRWVYGQQTLVYKFQLVAHATVYMKVISINDCVQYVILTAQGEPEYQDALCRGDGPGTKIISCLDLVTFLSSSNPHISVFIKSLSLSHFCPCQAITSLSSSHLFPCSISVLVMIFSVIVFYCLFRVLILSF